MTLKYRQGHRHSYHPKADVWFLISNFSFCGCVLYNFWDIATSHFCLYNKWMHPEIYNKKSNVCFQVIRMSMTFGDISKSLNFHVKSYYRVLTWHHTLAFDWCHFWWPWSTFEGHFSLGCHFNVHFSNLWQAFASRGLPAIAELLVHYKFAKFQIFINCWTIFMCLVYEQSLKSNTKWWPFWKFNMAAK